MKIKFSDGPFPEDRSRWLADHPHSKSAAADLVSTGQFSHCLKCASTTCPVNVLFARLFASVYFFVQRVRQIDQSRDFGVGHILSYSRTKFVIENLCSVNLDCSAQFITGYTLKSEINLVFKTDKLDDPTEPSGKLNIKKTKQDRELIHCPCFSKK